MTEAEADLIRRMQHKISFALNDAVTDMDIGEVGPTAVVNCIMAALTSVLARQVVDYSAAECRKAADERILSELQERLDQSWRELKGI